jgi:hypothetical protein
MWPAIAIRNCIDGIEIQRRRLLWRNRICYHFGPAQSLRSSGALPIQNDSPLPEGHAG